MDHVTDSTQINGCNIGSYSRMSKECRDCDKNEYCTNRKLEELNFFFSEKPPIVKKLAAVGGTTVEEAAAALKRLTEIRM